MAIKLHQVSGMINRLAPRDLACDWDNVGLQIGDYNQEIKKVLVTLDITEEVIDEAIKLDIDLIVAHHPFIFNGISNIKFNNSTGRIIKRVIKEDIAIYVAHTNYDMVVGGLNDLLADKLEVLNPKVLQASKNEGEKHGLGRVGKLENVTMLVDYIKLIKDRLDLDIVKVVGRLEDEIKKVALCSGSGADLIKTASFKGADLLVTGDVKYHEAQLAEELGLDLVDAGHYGTEKIMKEAVSEYLMVECRNNNFAVKIIESKVNTNPFKIF